MKVYVVTSGEYSDYVIEKIFLDKEKAKEFAKWVPSANDVEEYETADDVCYGKYYRVRASYVEGEKVRFLIDGVTEGANRETSVDYNVYRNRYELFIVRYIPEANWNEEKCKARMTKACYDYIGHIKYMLSDGATDKEVLMALSQKANEDDNK